MFIIGIVLGIGIAWKGSAWLTRRIGGVWTWTLISVVFVLSFVAPLIAGIGLLGLAAAAVAELFHEHELKQIKPPQDNNKINNGGRWN